MELGHQGEAERGYCCWGRERNPCSRLLLRHCELCQELRQLRWVGGGWKV